MIWTSARKHGLALSCAMMAVGLTMGATAVPAFAADKAKAAAPQYSDGFRKTAVPLQTALEKAKASKAPADIEAAKNLVAPLLAALQTPDDKAGAGGLVLGVGFLTNDPAMQRKGAELQIDSGKASPEVLPKLHIFVAQMAYDAKDYATARAHIKGAQDAGMHDFNVDAMAADSWLREGKNAEGMAAFKDLITRAQAANFKVDESWARLGLRASLDAQNADYSTFFAGVILKVAPTAANWNLAVAVARDTHLKDPNKYSNAETLDLMRLLDRVGGYQQERDYLDYVETADPLRNPAEVKAVLGKGIAAGKVKTDSPFVQDAQRIANDRLAKGDREALPEIEKAVLKPTAKPTAVVSAADAYLGFGNAAKAAELYKIALTRAETDKALVNTRLGIALYDLGDYAGAKAAFSAVTGLRQSVAQLWLVQVEAKAAGK